MRILLLSLLLSVGVLAETVRQPVADRAKGAGRVVVGVVETTTPRQETNDHGDQLIVSRLHVRVTEALKGPSTPTVDVDVEGGTVGEVTLTVSDITPLHQGETAVFFLTAPGKSGAAHLHLRGQGIIRLDAKGHGREEPTDLTAIRAQVKGGRP